MSLSRIYQNTALVQNTHMTLDANASHHLANVMRIKIGENIILFNGLGGEYLAVITEINKKSVVVKVLNFIPKDTESPLDLWLAQGISRGEKMDYTIQKAVELGVKKIIPLLTERCTVKLDAERTQKRLDHWQSIIIHAAQQSGRTALPELLPAMSFQKALLVLNTRVKLILSPYASVKLNAIEKNPRGSMTLCIGPEGGFSESEIKLAEEHQFSAIQLGPRILRTETAAVTAISVVQAMFGDLV